MEVKIQMIKKVFLALLIIPLSLSLTFTQNYLNDKVKFLFDSWKYNFGWVTFGGGYIRHILLFTDSNIVVIKTNHISHIPNVSNDVIFVFDNPSSIQEAILCIILNTVVPQFLPDPQEKMEEEIKNSINLTSENPTVGNFFNSISLILKKRNLECEIKEVISYNEIENVEIKGKGKEVRFKFRFKNKKHEYIANYNNHEFANKVRNTISKISKGVQSDKNYLTVFSEKTNIKNGDEIKRNTLFFELFGQGIGVSANTDYRFHPNLTFRAGLSYLIFGYGIPLSLNYITGANSSHHLELGLGITFGAGASIFGGSLVSFYFPTANFGYRYQPKNGGFVFRISFTPLFSIEKSRNVSRETGAVESYDQVVITPLVGISLGYCK